MAAAGVAVGALMPPFLNMWMRPGIAAVGDVISLAATPIFRKRHSSDSWASVTMAIFGMSALAPRPSVRLCGMRNVPAAGAFGTHAVIGIWIARRQRPLCAMIVVAVPGVAPLMVNDPVASVTALTM